MALVVVGRACAHLRRSQGLTLVVVRLARAVDRLLDGSRHLPGHVLVEADVEHVLEGPDPPGGRGVHRRGMVVGNRHRQVARRIRAGRGRGVAEANPALGTVLLEDLPGPADHQVLRDVEVVLEDRQAVARPGRRAVDHDRPDGEPRLDAVGGVAAGGVAGGIEGLGLVVDELGGVPGGIVRGGLWILRGARVLPGRRPDVPGGVLDPDADHELAALGRGCRRRAEHDAAGNREAGADDASPDPSHDQMTVAIGRARCASSDRRQLDGSNSNSTSPTTTSSPGRNPARWSSAITPISRRRLSR